MKVPLFHSHLVLPSNLILSVPFAADSCQTYSPKCRGNKTASKSRPKESNIPSSRSRFAKTSEKAWIPSKGSYHCLNHKPRRSERWNASNSNRIWDAILALLVSFLARFRSPPSINPWCGGEHGSGIEGCWSYPKAPVLNSLHIREA